MYTSEFLQKFETVQQTFEVECVVRDLFTLFNASGQWSSSLQEQCRWMLLSEAEKEAENEAYNKAQQAMTEEERRADFHRRHMVPVGNLAWLTTSCEFGLWKHKLIERNDMVIHAFDFGYGEPGRSDDPIYYIVYRPGDQDDYSKVRVFAKTTNRHTRREAWTNRPLQELYDQYQQLQTEEMCG